MARGWESKSVEEQMTEDERPSPRPEEASMSEDARRAAAQQRADTERRRQSLNLQREHILSQRTSSPSRRAALEAALEEIEAQIKSLD
jgi:hypothetical protein